MRVVVYTLAVIGAVVVIVALAALIAWLRQGRDQT